MATKRAKKSTRRVRDLAEKMLDPKQAKSVKGGYIGETEKRGASINWGDGRGFAVTPGPNSSKT